jgi:hypothetical protein
MGGNLLYVDRSCIECVNVFQGWNRCISFCVNPINPTWKYHAMYGTSTISTLNNELVAGGGNWIDRRHIIVMHGALLGCHHVIRCSRRCPGILELVIRVLYLVVHFLSTMQLRLVLNDASPLVELSRSKLCSHSLGGLMCGTFTLCAAQSWRSRPSSLIP